MSSIELTQIRKSYANGPEVLHGVDLSIAAGEFVVIVGPSGCGKSTLLRLIAGLEAASSGDIMIGGTRANDLAPQDRDIAMNFQNYALYPHMTVQQNIAFGLELRRLPKRERLARAREVAEMLQLTPYLDRKPGALSGGQRQRVAIGRAMARNSSTILMDEPLWNLDDALRVALRTEIKELHRQLGATIVFVTHDQTEAVTLAVRIAVIKDGHLQQVDTPGAIYDRPANRFAGGLGAEQARIWEQLAFLDAGDVVWLISLRKSGDKMHALRALAAERGAKVLALRDPRGAPFEPAPEAEICASRGGAGESQSLVVPMTIANTVILDLASIDEGRTMRALERFRSLRDGSGAF